MQKEYTKIIQCLKDVPGIQGIVLGGSRATKTATEDSDIDIGLYYDKEILNISQLSEAAKKLDDEHRKNVMTAIGEWGKGVNGGGWLQVSGSKVDILYRDIASVTQAITECQEGQIKLWYQTGHPHAFLNIMYAGELTYGEILWEKEYTITKLKEKIEDYPNHLKEAALSYFGFEMDFSLMLAEDQQTKKDLHYVTGHVFRVVSSIIQYTYALNEQYCLNEKRAIYNVAQLSKVPKNFITRVEAVYNHLTSNSHQQQLAVNLLKELIQDVKKLK